MFQFVVYITQIIMPRRCAFGCPSKGTSLHRFPDAKKFPERLKAWVSLVGGQLESPSDFEFYKKKMVCDRHFTNEDRNRNNRLNAVAIPSLHLQGVSMMENQNEDYNQLMAGSTSALPGTSAHPDILQPSNIGVSMMENQNEGYNQLTAASTSALSAMSAHLDISQPSNIGGCVIKSRQQTGKQVPVEIPTSTTFSGTQSMIWQPAKQGGIVPIPTEELPVNVTTESRNTSQFTKDEQHFDAAKRVTLEHNYSIISRSRPLAGKDSSTGKAIVSSKIRNIRSEISRLRKRAQTFKERLKNAEKVFNNTSINHLVQNMTSPAQLFVQMQLQTGKKPKGKRFSLDEKILSLSLYKKSPKCYTLLHKYFTLPSVKTIKRLLSQIKLCPGINPVIFNKIKSTVNELPFNDRLCSLIFDEMSLTPQIIYDLQKDAFEGFAFNNTNEFADHVMVFMIKSIKNKFKQPVAYYFTTRLNKIDLKKIIKEVVIQCQSAGLVIINTVCDQSTVNVSAITDLVEDTKRLYLRNGREWRHDIIRINKKNIIPIYDTPHLIKGIRNNLLNKDMSYHIDNEEFLVKWEYYQKLYSADLHYEREELRMVHKITEEHVNPDKINKMRVKTATQIFSHSVAVATEHLTARGDLPVECRQLIKITLLLDNLFDSLNVSSFLPVHGKKYTGAVKQGSCHHELWKKAKKVFKTIRFLESKKNGSKIRLIEKIVPSVTNFIKTIEGMEAIWEVLSKKYGFDSLLTRNFNQDPAENFFGSIRSYGARNNAPNSVGFQGAFKALLLNNYSSPHSIRANCEEDSSDCLQSLKFFITENTESSDVPKDDEIICNNEIFNIDFVNKGDAGQRNYVCGWVLTKCLKNIVKGCKQCKRDLLDNDHNKQNAFIKAKEYTNKKWLCYPNKETENCFHELQHIIVSFFKKDVPKKNVKKNINTFVELLIKYPFTCEKHSGALRQYFFDTSFSVIVHSWCRSINRILSGKLHYDGDDETKISAQKYYNKHKHYKNKK